MITELKNHPLHYLVLGMLVVVGMSLVISFRFNPVMKTGALLATGILYVLWGVVHHLSVNHLRLKVVLEYLLIATLGILILNSLI